MAYLHCHSCDWSQDDFWEFKLNLKGYYKFGYNPISLLLCAFKEYFNLRICNWDSNFIKENPEIKYKENENGTVSIRNIRIFFYELKNFFWRILRQKWWTWEQWEKARKKNPKCPKCGANNFDID